MIICQYIYDNMNSVWPWPTCMDQVDLLLGDVRVNMGGFVSRIAPQWEPRQPDEAKHIEDGLPTTIKFVIYIEV